MKKEEVRLPPAPQKDRLRAVFFMEKEGVGSKRKGKTLRAFHSSARRLACWRTGHQRFLSDPAPLGKGTRFPVIKSNTLIIKMFIGVFCIYAPSSFPK